MPNNDSVSMVYQEGLARCDSLQYQYHGLLGGIVLGGRFSLPTKPLIVPSEQRHNIGVLKHVTVFFVTVITPTAFGFASLAQKR